MADRTWDSINRSVINGGPISDGSDYKMMAGKSSKELLDEALDQRHREFIGGNQFKDIQTFKNDVINELIDVIYVHENNQLTIKFKYQDEYEQAINMLNIKEADNYD